MSSQTGSPGGTIHILVDAGDTPALADRRNELLVEAEADLDLAERFNLAVDEPSAIVDAAGVADLFGGRRVVWVDGFEEFPERLAERLGEALRGGDCLMVARTTRKPTKSLLSKLGQDVAKVEVFEAGTGRKLVPRILEMSKTHGVSISSRDAGQLANAKLEDLSALDEGFRHLADRGVHVVGQAELAELQALAGGTPPPWDLSDRIEEGDAAGALEVLGKMAGVNEFATFAYLYTRLRDITLVQEAGAKSAEEIQKLLNMRHPFPAQKMLRTIARTTPEKVSRAWEELGMVERRLRTERDTRGVLAEFVVGLSRAFAR